MNFDFGTIAGLSLFRGVLGLALGVQLGNAWRDFRGRKIFNGIVDLGQGVVFAGLVAFMQSEIRQYDDYPFIYWGVFALTVLTGTFKTKGVLKTVSLGAYVILGGSFFFMGGWLFLSALRSGFNIVGLIAGLIFMGVGAIFLGAMLYPYFKGKSIND